MGKAISFMMYRERRVNLKCCKLSEHGHIPTHGSKKAAGMDLYSAYDYVVPPQERTLIKTDIQIAMPDGCYGRIAPRSGLAKNHFIDIGAGVIDPDYRGNVEIIMYNFGKKHFNVKKGDSIAQLILEKIFITPYITEVPKLNETERGNKGFGSTNVYAKRPKCTGSAGGCQLESNYITTNAQTD